MKLLLDQGNALVKDARTLPNEYGFIRNKDGWLCYLAHPIDLGLIKKHFNLPPTIHLSKEADEIFCERSWISISSTVHELVLVRLAYQKNAVASLLLGAPPYCCHSYIATPLPAGVSTDVTVLWCGLRHYQSENPKMEPLLLKAIYAISHSLLGIWTLASFIAIEARLTSVFIEINISDLALLLKLKIIQYQQQLKAEKLNFNGDRYPDGVLGELKRLAQISLGHDGPDFYPEENEFLS